MRRLKFIASTKVDCVHPCDDTRKGDTRLHLAMYWALRGLDGHWDTRVTWFHMISGSANPLQLRHSFDRINPEQESLVLTWNAGYCNPSELKVMPRRQSNGYVRVSWSLYYQVGRYWVDSGVRTRGIRFGDVFLAETYLQRSFFSFSRQLGEMMEIIISKVLRVNQAWIVPAQPIYIQDLFGDAVMELSSLELSMLLEFDFDIPPKFATFHPTCCQLYEPNVEYVRCPTENVIWILRTRDVREGEILWLLFVRANDDWGGLVDILSCSSSDSEPELAIDRVDINSLTVSRLVDDNALGTSSKKEMEQIDFDLVNESVMCEIHTCYCYYYCNHNYSGVSEVSISCLMTAEQRMKRCLIEDGEYYEFVCNTFYVVFRWLSLSGIVCSAVHIYCISISMNVFECGALRMYCLYIWLSIECCTECDSISMCIGICEYDVSQRSENSSLKVQWNLAGMRELFEGTNICLIAENILVNSRYEQQYCYFSFWQHHYDRNIDQLCNKRLVRHYKQSEPIGMQLGKEYSSNNAGDGPDDNLFEDNYEYHNYCEQDKARMRIAFWNTNGHMSSEGTEVVTSFMKHFRVDIMVLSDVRMHVRAARYHASAIKREIVGASVLSLPTSRIFGQNGGGERMNTMGGTMFVIAPRCATNIVDKKADPSGLGILGYVKLVVNQKKLCIISMYKPILQPNPGASTVLHRLRQFLRKRRISKDPTTYVFDLVSHWIGIAKRDGYVVVIGGDFNADPMMSTSVGNHLRNWASEMQLINALRISFPEGYFTHRCTGREVSSIDHIYVGNNDETSAVVSACVGSHPMILAASDHNPVGISLEWPEFRGKFRMESQRSNIAPTLRIEIPHHDARVCVWYKDLMDRWFVEHKEELELLSSEQGMQVLMKESVDVTKELTGWKQKLSSHLGFRSSFKGGFSPIFRALKSALRIVMQYRHIILNKLGRGMTMQRVHAGFVKACQGWTKQYPASGICTEDNSVLSAIYGKVDYLLTSIRLRNNVDTACLNKAIKDILGLMHGRKRSEFRLRMSERVSQMELMRQQNRIGELFRMVNLKDKAVVDLTSLTISGEVITNPAVIHGKLTETFRTWYQMPDNLHEEAQKFWTPDYWKHLVHGHAHGFTGGGDDDDDDDGMFKLKLFREACKSRVSSEQRLCIAENVLQPISEQEYMSEVNKMAHGKAPGPSGVTANMVKEWPEAIHKQMLEWLNQIWRDKSPPSWWNIAHLRPIPKPGEQSLENLRPLGLYEISRKILTSIVIKRVYNQWEFMNLLNPNQHAFRRGLSTANAIWRLLNVAEDAEEWESPLGVILWDFRRAFDSIDYNFTRMALIRLGMPENAMEFLLSMMENNVMAVASPFHLSQHEEEGCVGEHFHQERGTGQGDPPSPIIWIAVFDILLYMLGAENVDGIYYAHGKASEVYKVNDIAYADDLVTISNSSWAQQYKADIVSTFCACTGMAIAAVKVKVFQLKWKETNDVVIYDNKWQPIWLEPMTGQLLVRYLGLCWDTKLRTRRHMLIRWVI